VIHAESVKMLVRAPVRIVDNIPAARNAGMLVLIDVSRVTSTQWETHAQLLQQEYLSRNQKVKRRDDSDAVMDVGHKVCDLPMHLMHHSSLYRVRGKVRDILKEQIAHRVGLRGRRHVYVQLLEDLDAVYDY
jgi:hypothetical protein